MKLQREASGDGDNADVLLEVLRTGIIVPAAGIREYSLRKRRIISHEEMAKLSSRVISRMIFMMFKCRQPVLNKKELRLLDPQDMVAKAEQRVRFVFVNIEDRQQFGGRH